MFRTLKQCQLTLKQTDESETPIEIIEKAGKCHFFKNLSTENCCTVQIEEIAAGKDSPKLNVKLDLKHSQEDPLEAAEPYIVFTNGTTLFRLHDWDDYLIQSEPMVVPFLLEGDQKITAVSSMSSDELLIGLSDGSVHLIDMRGENLTTIQKKLREPDAIPITQIAVDQVQECFYIVREQTGLTRCFMPDCRDYTNLITSSLSYIQNIVVDAWNGYLYYITNAGDAFSTPLFMVDSPKEYKLQITRRIPELAPVYTLDIEYKSQRLLALLRNGSLIGMNLIDQEVTDEREEFEINGKYHNVVRSHYYENRLFWTSNQCEHENTPCLFSEEKNPESNSLNLNRYLYNGKVVDFAIMRDLPKPLSLSPLTEIGLMVTDTSGKVSWRPPKPMPFQAPIAHGSNWRRLTFDCQIKDTVKNSTVSEKSGIEIHEYQFEADASKAYEAMVRACAKDGTCSEWTSTLNSAFNENETEALAVFAKQIDKLGAFDLAGEEIERSVPKNLPTSGLVSYESFSDNLYSVSEADSSIYRIFHSERKKKFLDFLKVKYMVVLSRTAILTVASSYQITAYRLTGSFYKSIYNAEEGGAEVVGVAGDDVNNMIVFFLQKEDGVVEKHSYKIGGDEQGSQVVASLKTFPKIRQIAVLAKKFVFITTDSLLGICDTNLRNMNLNYALKDVQHLISYSNWSKDKPAPDRAQFLFPQGIEFGGDNRNLISWSIQPNLIKGHALYKILLYPSGLDAKPTVDYSLSPSYTIPGQVLDKWNSKQQFDAQISVITAWTETEQNKTDLTAPTKPPNPPVGLKIFATTQKTVDGPRAVIDLFWDEPTEWNGDMLGYVVNCTNEADGRPEQVFSENVSARFSRAYSLEVKSGKVRCAVAARNEQNIVGKFSEQVEIDSGEFKPLVRLFAIDSTDQLLNINDWSNTKPPASETTRKKREGDSVKYQSVAFIGNDLYAIRREQETTQPFLSSLDINDVGNVLHKIPVTGEFSQISAMGSDWVGNRLLLVGNHDLLEIQLENFENLVAVTPKKLFSLSAGAQDAKQMIVDPFTNTAYLLSKNGSLFSLDLTKQTEVNIGLHVDCLKSQTVTSVVGEFVWNKPASPLIYALTWNGLITIDPISRKCSDINIDWTKFGEKGLKSVNLFTLADKTFIIFVTSSQLFIYDRSNNNVTPIPIINPPLKQILAASQASQPYPDRSCFTLPSSEGIQFNVINEGRSGALVNVGEAVVPTGCRHLSNPPTQYEIHFKRRDSEKVKHITTIQTSTHVENGILDKETDYDVSISTFNRYFPPAGQSESHHLRTSYGYPTAPQDPKVFALTPDTVVVYWKLPSTLNAPPSEIKYRITQKTKTTLPVVVGAKPFVNGDFGQLSDIVSCSLNPCQAKISNLRTSSNYEFYITAIHVNRLNFQLVEENEAISIETQTKTKDVPGTLRAENATSSSLLLRFNSLEPQFLPDDIFLQYRQSGVDASWLDVQNSTFDQGQNPVLNMSITDLRSCTTYDYRFVAEYSDKFDYDGIERQFTERFYQQSQQARTKPGTPSAPLDMSISPVRDGFVLKWNPPENDGGSPITRYALDFRRNSTSEWEIAEVKNQPDFLQWRVLPTIVPEPKIAEFRVRAGNDEGLGAYASLKSVMEPDQSPVEPNSIWFWPLFVLVVLVMMMVILFLSGLLYFRHKNQKAKKRKQRINKQINLQNIGDIEFPTAPSQIPPELQNEIQNLPKIPKSSLRIQQELGKGSFGVVNKGLLQNWDVYGPKGVYVAIKVMKGCCRDQKQRSHFLKEAILMNNFDHPNMIKLLGVCLDDPNDHMLVMEFMEGGDLNVFLRECRVSHNHTGSIELTFAELISMIVDIGRGCAHLEMHHFVHRDYATRNCLLTAKEAPRTTKIADFGMARDIYKDDYYRLNGNDLLPLRWLAPESASSGVFSCKSDVWAFGILMWEIMTMAEKPFGHMDNPVVLMEIKNGNHPKCPINCPEEIFRVMQRCWIVDIEKRPTFAELLPDLELLRCNHHMFHGDPYSIRVKENTRFDGEYNIGFDNSNGSSSSFNRSANRNLFPEQNRYYLGGDDSSSYRPFSGISGETRTTNTDYEKPRSSSTSTSHSRNASGYGTDRPNDGFAYRNNAFRHDSDYESPDSHSLSQAAFRMPHNQRALRPYNAEMRSNSMNLPRDFNNDSPPTYGGRGRISQV
ncbi:unnamed protein product [Bursaphelenchus okinawaensis]|uniref:Tyrosine-protein kinase receptor n=1 Tax=Bursaphelenchus okinawaensis TaxID=465554 RepID=A0A811L9K6_9BILA|nr:unnamed protein product [Bursaphelenchus okinawaensis]CAG9118957.1 unnamed protein product [Bursaphelenchus okinawaensis]